MEMHQEIQPTIKGTAVFRSINYAYSRGFRVISEQGASRSGKTYNTMLYLVVYCYQRKTKVSVVRQTINSLKRSVLEDFKDIMHRLDIWERQRFNMTDLIYKFDNGSVIEFFSADDEQKLRGSKRDILFVNEANELTEIKWQQLIMRTTMFGIIDYNPSFSDNHWICRLNVDPRTYHFITTYKDNPYLEQTIVDEIESLQWKNPSLWRIYGLGLQAIVEGLVFPNVEQVENMPDIFERTYIGVDYGYSNDPTAIVRVAFTKDAMYIDEITYNTKLLTNDIIKILKDNCRNEEIISESADPRIIQEIYRAGLNIKAVKKYGGSIQAGITKMLEYKIRITTRSTNVLKEFKNYTWAQDKEGNWVNLPIDAFNHAIDAIRYVVLEKLLGGINRRGVVLRN